MSLDDFQKDVDKWTSQFEPQYWPPHQLLTQMTEELGELAREVNNLHGVKKKKETEDIKNKLGQEIVDLFFAGVCMANYHGIDLKKEWDKMMAERRYGRDNDRFEKK